MARYRSGALAALLLALTAADLGDGVDVHRLRHRDNVVVARTRSRRGAAARVGRHPVGSRRRSQPDRPRLGRTDGAARHLADLAGVASRRRGAPRVWSSGRWLRARSLPFPLPVVACSVHATARHLAPQLTGPSSHGCRCWWPLSPSCGGCGSAGLSKVAPQPSARFDLYYQDVLVPDGAHRRAETQPRARLPDGRRRASGLPLVLPRRGGTVEWVGVRRPRRRDPAAAGHACACSCVLLAGCRGSPGDGPLGRRGRGRRGRGAAAPGGRGHVEGRAAPGAAQLLAEQPDHDSRMGLRACRCGMPGRGTAPSPRRRPRAGAAAPRVRRRCGRGQVVGRARHLLRGRAGGARRAHGGVAPPLE